VATVFLGGALLICGFIAFLGLGIGAGAYFCTTQVLGFIRKRPELVNMLSGLPLIGPIIQGFGVPTGNKVAKPYINGTGRNNGHYLNRDDPESEGEEESENHQQINNEVKANGHNNVEATPTAA